ncbi:hypothetical protein TWF481_006421 [Arthrobotrys musiformis]|uniref:Uncharacterized protein n=1 Tax=Arthrobotrys musiformis TaxID=47236 RepID=A0AAV9WGQ1_9PEZI
MFSLWLRGEVCRGLVSRPAAASLIKRKSIQFGSRLARPRCWARAGSTLYYSRKTTNEIRRCRQVPALKRHLTYTGLRMADEKPDPGPPVEEPPGYHAQPGWVKSRWENNDYYVEKFAGNPWYPIIKDTHEEIKSLVPNYNITQIKEKYGELCYYVEFPEVIEPKNGYTTSEQIQTRVYEIIAYAEGWVAGFEEARKNISK